VIEQVDVLADVAHRLLRNPLVWWLAVAREADVVPLYAVAPACVALTALLVDIDARLQPSGGLAGVAASGGQLEAALAAVDAEAVRAARDAIAAVERSLLALADHLDVVRGLRDDVGG
jgi:hypothetical protein